MENLVISYKFMALKKAISNVTNMRRLLKLRTCATMRNTQSNLSKAQSSKRL